MCTIGDFCETPWFVFTHSDCAARWESNGTKRAPFLFVSRGWSVFSLCRTGFREGILNFRGVKWNCRSVAGECRVPGRQRSCDYHVSFGQLEKAWSRRPSGCAPACGACEYPKISSYKRSRIVGLVGIAQSDFCARASVIFEYCTSTCFAPPMSRDSNWPAGLWAPRFWCTVRSSCCWFACIARFRRARLHIQIQRTITEKSITRFRRRW